MLTLMRGQLVWSVTELGGETGSAVREPLADLGSSPAIVRSLCEVPSFHSAIRGPQILDESWDKRKTVKQGCVIAHPFGLRWVYTRIAESSLESGGT